MLQKYTILHVKYPCTKQAMPLDNDDVTAADMQDRGKLRQQTSQRPSHQLLNCNADVLRDKPEAVRLFSEITK